MTSDLCTEEVVVQITAPQIITTESVSVAAPGAGVRAAAGGGGSALELGRRLLLAARAGDTALVLDLMAKGAPFTTDWLGTSPLHLAASNAHAETCGVLLRAGVSRDSRTKVERTPLHLAAYAGHAIVAAKLLEHGALVDCRDMLRMTPLHWAAERGHTACCSVLLRYGADPRALSKFRKTPRQLARDQSVLALLDAAQRTDLPDRPPDEPMEPERQYTSVHKIQEVKIRPKPAAEKITKIENKTEPAEQKSEKSANSESGAAQLLRRHGITLLPADTGSTVLNALQSGRTVVLSDAGKLMLKESEDDPTPVSGAVSVATTGAGGATRANRGMVLTATPVRTPPAPGVKVFTINNRLLSAAKTENTKYTRIMTQQELQQVKFVQLPADARVLPPRKAPRRRLLPGPPGQAPAAPGQAPAAPGQAPRAPRAPVKIIMNKSNFERLVANAHDLEGRGEAASTPVVVTPDLPPTDVSPSLLSSGSTSDLSSLRAQLAAAHRAVASLSEQLRDCQERLAQYEPNE